MKGKVLDSIAAGLPSVLSPAAAEGIGLSDGVDTIIARSPRQWAAAIAKIYNDQAVWEALSAKIHDLAQRNFSFARGIDRLQEALASIEFYTQPGQALYLNSARPQAPRFLPEPYRGPVIAAKTGGPA